MTQARYPRFNRLVHELSQMLYVFGINLLALAQLHECDAIIDCNGKHKRNLNRIVVFSCCTQP